MKSYELVEMLEGPRKEVLPNKLRAKVKVTQETNKGIGWVTWQDDPKLNFAELVSKEYTCTAPIAITEGPTIKDCKVIRSLVVKEKFEASGGMVADEAAGVLRIPGKAPRDGTEGWVTIKGK